MMAQLSHIAPLGNPASCKVGVRWEGFIAENSGVLVFPQTSASSKSSPAARTKMRTVRLLTLGLRMLSVFAATSASLSLDEGGLVLAPTQAPPRDELDVRLDDEHVPESVTDRFREPGIGPGLALELDGHAQ